jgi:hypothetical protein
MLIYGVAPKTWDGNLLLLPQKWLQEKWLPTFTQPPVTLQEFVHSSAKAVFGIVAGYSIQLPVVRYELLV